MRILYAFVLLILFNSCKTSTNVLTTKIIEVEDIQRPITNVEDYQGDDVKVFRKTSESQIFYALTLFRDKKDDSSRPYYIGVISALNTYDTAEYEWVNDSTVTFILKNKFHTEKPFTVSGYGGTTSMSVEE